MIGFVFSIQFTQECVYKYTSTQHNYGEEDREVIEFSADVNWHCDSSKIVVKLQQLHHNHCVQNAQSFTNLYEGQPL